jgi:hypothetical protein
MDAVLAEPTTTPTATGPCAHRAQPDRQDAGTPGAGDRHQGHLPSRFCGRWARRGYAGAMVPHLEATEPACATWSR